MQIRNGQSEYCWRYRADTILSTDGQTDKVKPVYPHFNFVEAGGIMMNVFVSNAYRSTTKSLIIFVVPNPKTLMFLVSSCSCLCAIYWSQVLVRPWRYSWTTANRRCSIYIWVINILLPTKVGLMPEVWGKIRKKNTRIFHLCIVLTWFSLCLSHWTNGICLSIFLQMPNKHCLNVHTPCTNV